MSEAGWSLSFASDSSVLISRSKEDAISGQVVRLFQSLEKARLTHSLLGAIENLHPAYNSLLVDFDPLQTNPEEFISELERAVSKLDAKVKEVREPVEIPVIYGGDEGPDLAHVASVTGLSESEVIRKHSDSEYLVSFLGFAPGFPYLEGLPGELACPRLEHPRLKVPKGSVAIGGRQTGIYSSESPGGWLIIGQTNLKLFDVNRDRPSLLNPGDRVRFVPINQSKNEPHDVD